MKKNVSFRFAFLFILICFTLLRKSSVLTPETHASVIVKASSGPRYVVGCRNKVPREKLKQGVRVALDMTTLTIMRILPREVDPLVYQMSVEDPGNINFNEIGGLMDQVREIREVHLKLHLIFSLFFLDVLWADGWYSCGKKNKVIELPLINPELFLRVGIKPPKGVLLYGPPGTGKTLLAKAVASTMECNFLKVVSSAIVDKYIGESARVIREMFGMSVFIRSATCWVWCIAKSEILYIQKKRLCKGS